MSPSRNWMATVAAANEILVWNMRSYRLHSRLSAPASEEPLGTFLAFSPDEKLLGAGTQAGAVRIWQVADGQIWRDILPTSEGVARVAFASDGHTIATTLSAQGGTLWDRESGMKVASFGGRLEFWDICFSPNHAQIFAAGGVDGAIGFQVPSGRESARLSRHRGMVGRLAISADGLTLATLATDNHLRLWHVPTGRELFAPLSHSQELVWVQFASPTKLLVGSRLQGDSRLGVFVLSADSALPIVANRPDAH